MKKLWVSAAMLVSCGFLYAQEQNPYGDGPLAAEWAAARVRRTRAFRFTRFRWWRAISQR
jgi:hypothetical protein